ncbi:MAG: hypothetical protein WBQ73_02805 [Candidatus Babeliales bacterium]
MKNKFSSLCHTIAAVFFLYSHIFTANEKNLGEQLFPNKNQSQSPTNSTPCTTNNHISVNMKPVKTDIAVELGQNTRKALNEKAEQATSSFTSFCDLISSTSNTTNNTITNAIQELSKTFTNLSNTIKNKVVEINSDIKINSETLKALISGMDKTTSRFEAMSTQLCTAAQNVNVKTTNLCKIEIDQRLLDTAPYLLETIKSSTKDVCDAVQNSYLEAETNHSVNFTVNTDTLKTADNALVTVNEISERLTLHFNPQNITYHNQHLLQSLHNSLSHLLWQGTSISLGFAGLYVLYKGFYGDRKKGRFFTCLLGCTMVAASFMMYPTEAPSIITIDPAP